MTDLRLAGEADLAAIAAIERASFGNPWPLDAYAQELQRRCGFLEVAVEESRVAGFSCVWQVAQEAHLLRIATHPHHRRRGVGWSLLQAALDRGRRAECLHVTLEVAASNRPAIMLYRTAGFVEIGRREGYYRVPVDDAIVMRRSL